MYTYIHQVNTPKQQPPYAPFVTTKMATTSLEHFGHGTVTGTSNGPDVGACGLGRPAADLKNDTIGSIHGPTRMKLPTLYQHRPQIAWKSIS